MSDQRRVDVIVSVDAEQWTETVAAAQRAGLQVDDEHQILGTLAGSIQEDRLADLEAVEGVRAVERSRNLRIPPPDAPVQ
jgi:hypothetical protein